MNCGIGHRCDLDTAWLWLCLWQRLAVAGPIQPLAWELPYATGVAVKRPKKKKKCVWIFLKQLHVVHFPVSGEEFVNVLKAIL